MLRFLRGLWLAPVLLLASPLQAQNNYSYTVLDRFYQSAAPNRREADITVIRCGSGHDNSGKKYYIYHYLRMSPPMYRTIIPPYWGNPVGGRDHESWIDAVHAACH